MAMGRAMLALRKKRVCSPLVMSMLPVTIALAIRLKQKQAAVAAMRLRSTWTAMASAMMLIRARTRVHATTMRIQQRPVRPLMRVVYAAVQGIATHRLLQVPSVS